MTQETKKLLQGNDFYPETKNAHKKKKGCKKCDTEMVTSPKHYNAGTIEVIDAIEEWQLGFNDGNAVKYVARHRYKGKAIQDIEKAIWYLNRHLTNLKEQAKNSD